VRPVIIGLSCAGTSSTTATGRPMGGDGGKARKPPKSRLHVPTFGRAKGLGEAVSKNPGENGQRKALCRRHF
jgi:hypothetical protein